MLVTTTWRVSQDLLTGNQARITGDELYVGDIDTCTLIDGEVVNLATALRQIHCGQTDVSSDARNLTFTDDDFIKTTRIESFVSPYPGTELSVPITATSQLDGFTQANIILTYDKVFDADGRDVSDFINVSYTNITRSIHVKTVNTPGTISLAAFSVI